VKVGDLVEHIYDQTRGTAIILSRHKEGSHWLVEVMWGTNEKSLVFEHELFLISRLK